MNDGIIILVLVRVSYKVRKAIDDELCFKHNVIIL